MRGRREVGVAMRGRRGSGSGNEGRREVGVAMRGRREVVVAMRGRRERGSYSILISWVCHSVVSSTYLHQNQQMKDTLQLEESTKYTSFSYIYKWGKGVERKNSS